MFPKLVFPRPSGLHLLVRRSGSKLTAQLLSGVVVLARATGDAGSSYVFPDSDTHHALNVGYSASFDVTPEEAEVIRDRLGIGPRPMGNGTSFECGAIVRDVMLSYSAALIAGAQA
jgi:hypothetical protein